ncbi:MAG: hypothetical protein L7H09_03095 [Acidilobus sp.]|nr:hypothetical protein [Acidilobus sp.]MCG2897077.1 hypothetical protein [Acidilobus sp.]
MVVDKEEDLRARVQAGWYIKRDRWGFKVKDPQTGAEERVSGDLEDVAAKLYAQQRYGRAKETEGGEGGKGGIEGDLAYIIGMIRTKVDSRAPILQKWAEDILWWQHILSDTTTKILPDLLARLRVEEIDLEDPEKTAEALVRHYVELRTAAQSAEALRQKYEEELRARDEKIKMLEDRLKALQEAYDGLGKLLEDFATRTKMTLDFISRQVPPYLPADARRTYRLLISKVQEIWRGMNVEQ